VPEHISALWQQVNEPSGMNERFSRIPSLDGLRAISIGLVVIGHAIHTQNFIRFGNLVGKRLELGALGVRVFFVISGYLITSLLLHELDTSGRIRVTKFYFRRTFRIFPPYYALILANAGLYLFGWIGLTSADLLHAVTYTVNYYPDRSWALGHAWSLSVEEQFYLLWPAVLLLAGRRRGLWIAFAIMLVCPLIRLGYFYVLPWLIRYEVGYRFETVADAIAVGCVLAGVYQWIQRNRLCQRALQSRLFALVPLMLIALSAWNPRLRTSLLFAVTLQNVGIAACLAWCMTNSSGNIGYVLNSRPMVFLGLMSYSVYLWQQLFLDPFSSSSITRFPLNVVLVAIAALTSYYLVERPALRLRQWLERWVFDRRRDEQPD
jgi:peptidoglycan/LPS O-acetylase OafA/YrhL